MDTLARLTALLDRVEKDGGKVIAIAAVRRALNGEPDPPEQAHILVVEGGGCWLMQHPDSCPDTIPCPVVTAAHRTLKASTYTDGQYEAWVGHSGWLCTQARQP